MEQPKVQLVRTYHLCTAHKLYNKNWSPEKNLEVYSHCANTHGHHYKLTFYFLGAISKETGMVVNAYEIDKLLDPFLKNNFDHKFLNEDVPFFKETTPTAEWIAYWLYNEIRKLLPTDVTLKKVEVFETPDLGCVYPDVH